MSKPKLVFKTSDYVNFNHGSVRPVATQYFDLEEYNPNERYSPHEYTVLTAYQTTFDSNPWWKSLQESGLKVIVDHLFDSDVDTTHRLLSDNMLELRSGNWMWYRTALLQAQAGYSTYKPEKNVTHTFLMLMNKIRDHRDWAQRDLAPLLPNARWSYVDRGIDLGDDRERSTPVFWEYYMHPDWYNSTAFSVVVESWQRTMPWVRNPEVPNYRTEVSEKIFKPLAYFHPFVCIGSEGTCRYLQRAGFETFGNLWDESYDNILDDLERYQAAKIGRAHV